MTAQRRVLEAMAAGYPMYLGIDREWWCHGRRVPRLAKELGRQAVGIELNPAYIALAENRLRQEVLAL